MSIPNGQSSESLSPFWDDPEALARSYREMRKARKAGDPARWLLLIKELRVTHCCSILDAERIALAQPVWRRWVERQINHDARCAKSARRHIRHNGDSALLEERGDCLAVR